MLSSSSPHDMGSPAPKDGEIKSCDSFEPKVTSFQSKALTRFKFHLNCYGIVEPSLIKKGLYRITFPKNKLMSPLYCDVDKDEIIYPISPRIAFETSVENSGSPEAILIYHNFYGHGKPKKILMSEVNDKLVTDAHELRFFRAYDDYKELVKCDLHALFKQDDNYITRISTVIGVSKLDDLHITTYEINQNYKSHTYRFRIGDSKKHTVADEKSWDCHPETELGSQDLRTVVFQDRSHMAILCKVTGNFHITACPEFNEFPVYLPKTVTATMPQFGVLGNNTIIYSGLIDGQEGIFAIDINLKEKKYLAHEKPMQILPKGSLTLIYGLNDNIVMLVKKDSHFESLQCYEMTAERKELKPIEKLSGITQRKTIVKLESGEVVFWDTKTRFLTIINPHAKELIQVKQIENVDYLLKGSDRDVIAITKEDLLFRCDIPDYALQAAIKQKKEFKVDVLPPTLPVPSPVKSSWTTGPVKFHTYSVFAERKHSPAVPASATPSLTQNG